MPIPVSVTVTFKYSPASNPPRAVSPLSTICGMAATTTRPPSGVKLDRVAQKIV